MKVLIIEDEIPAQKRLKDLLNELDPSIQVDACLESIAESIDWFQHNPLPDLLFLDIQLADGLSFSILANVEIDVPIIFCTAYDEYAIQAFKHNSIDYLLKPISYEDLGTALDKFKKLSLKKSSKIDLKAVQQLLTDAKKSYKSRFMVKVGEKIKSINTEAIGYFYSEHKASYMQTHDAKRFLIDYALDQLESLLDPSRFFRLNRKYIASIDAIDSVITYSNSRLKIKIKGCDDESVLVSREKVNKLKEWLDS